MKYQCEICGAVMTDKEKCAEHENECRIHHQAALFILEELGVLMSSAKNHTIGLGVELTTSTADDKTKTDFCTLTGVEFNAAKNRVIIYVKQSEAAVKTTTEKGDKPVKKSS